MFLQQNTKSVAIKKFFAIYFREFHPENFKLSTYMHREIKEKSIVSAMRDTVDKDLKYLQDFNETIGDRCIIPEDAISC